MTNTTPSVVQTSLNNSQLTLTGLANGTSTVVVCASSTSCASLTTTVGSTNTTPLSFPASTLMTGTVGQAYAAQLSATGGSGTYSYALTVGSLPAGLTLAQSGIISGTPTDTGSANFTVKATDTGSASASANFTLTVNSLSSPITPSVPVSLAYNNGQLISENGTIYIVYQNTKVGFANAAAFLGLGFKFKDVTPATNSGLTISPKVIITADGGHSRGTWILSGKTIYFVSPTGLIPVADWNIFLNNGGQAGYIVKANSYDLAMKKLPLLTNNDPRLHP